MLVAASHVTPCNKAHATSDEGNPYCACRPRQARAYIPEPCFALEHLIASGRLVVTHDIATPPPTPPPSGPAATSYGCQRTSADPSAPDAVAMLGSNELHTHSASADGQDQQGHAQATPFHAHSSANADESPARAPAMPLPTGPCVVIVPAASLTPGGLAHRLVQTWGHNPHATLILTPAAVGPAPGACAAAANALRAAHPTLRMQIVECALGGPPPATQLAALLAGLQQPPPHVLAWHQEAEALTSELSRFARAPQAAGARAKVVEVVGYRWLDVVKLKLPKHVAEVGVSQPALGSVAWRPVHRAGQSAGGAVAAGSLQAVHGQLSPAEAGAAVAGAGSGSSVSQAGAATARSTGLVAGRLSALLQFREGAWQVNALPAMGPHPASTAAAALASAAAYTLSGLASGCSEPGGSTAGQLLYGRPTLQATIAALKVWAAAAFAPSLSFSTFQNWLCTCARSCDHYALACLLTCVSVPLPVRHPACLSA